MEQYKINVRQLTNFQTSPSQSHPDRSPTSELTLANNIANNLQKTVTLTLRPRSQPQIVGRQSKGLLTLTLLALIRKNPSHMTVSIGLSIHYPRPRTANL